MHSGITCRGTSESSTDLKHEQTPQKETVLCLAVTTGRTVRELLGITAVKSRVTAGNNTVLAEQVKPWRLFVSSVPSLQENKCGKMALFFHCCVTFPGMPSRLVGAQSPPNTGLMQTQARQCLLPRHDSPQGQMVIAGTATWA